MVGQPSGEGRAPEQGSAPGHVRVRLSGQQDTFTPEGMPAGQQDTFTPEGRPAGAPWRGLAPASWSATFPWCLFHR